ncbi:protein HOMOLOG OF MAMMALIAN LYST-INTERACTING PROTEIN 5, partial [Carica papaya]|uniref:protein HOMOLOG OF MAMMALIAN LYST-INTERACTING PROTEIN 5 n=1 Tax=Carica papaya TaxID=3649 RepID=UPI000B8CF44E
MASENEPAKLLLPYLQRADELQKHEPLVAYYCRLFAMERGLKIPQSERTKTTNSLLMSLINQLEKDKKSLKLSPDDNLHLEGFALNVFAKADKQDRAGRADLNTAKTFYAASIFFEVLNQFGPLAPDLEQKQKYAVWKAADIRKALKEGRKPNPGPPSGDDDLSALASTPSMAHDLQPGGTAVTSPRTEPDPSPQFHNKVNQHSSEIRPPHQFQDDINRQHSTDILPPSQFHTNVNSQYSADILPPSQFHDNVSSEYSADILPPSQFHDNVSIPPSCSSYMTSSYPTHDLPPPANRPENSTYS